MIIRNLILGVNSVTVSYLIDYESLLQNAAAILLQNATNVYCKMRQVFYYKMRQFYYKLRQLLQIATILLQNAIVITKSDVYYKLRQYILTRFSSSFFYRELMYFNMLHAVLYLETKRHGEIQKNFK